MLDPLVKAKNGFLRYACSANTLSIASISLAVLDAPLNSLTEKSILPLEMRSPSKSGGKRPKMKCIDKERRCVITYKSDSSFQKHSNSKDSQKPLYHSTTHLINILVSERDFDRIVCRYKSTSLLQWKDNVTKG